MKMTAGAERKGKELQECCVHGLQKRILSHGNYSDGGSQAQ